MSKITDEIGAYGAIRDLGKQRWINNLQLRTCQVKRLRILRQK